MRGSSASTARTTTAAQRQLARRALDPLKDEQVVGEPREPVRLGDDRREDARSAGTSSSMSVSAAPRIAVSGVRSSVADVGHEARLAALLAAQLRERALDLVGQRVETEVGDGLRRDPREVTAHAVLAAREARDAALELEERARDPAGQQLSDQERGDDERDDHPREPLAQSRMSVRIENVDAEAYQALLAAGSGGDGSDVQRDAAVGPDANVRPARSSERRGYFRRSPNNCWRCSRRRRRVGYYGTSAVQHSKRREGTSGPRS